MLWQQVTTLRVTLCKVKTVMLLYLKPARYAHCVVLFMPKTRFICIQAVASPDCIRHRVCDRSRNVEHAVEWIDGCSDKLLATLLNFATKQRGTAHRSSLFSQDFT
jgi:hypothetical protein